MENEEIEFRDAVHEWLAQIMFWAGIAYHEKSAERIYLNYPRSCDAVFFYGNRSLGLRIELPDDYATHNYKVCVFNLGDMPLGNDESEYIHLVQRAHTAIEVVKLHFKNAKPRNCFGQCSSCGFYRICQQYFDGRYLCDRCATEHEPVIEDLAGYVYVFGNHEAGYYKIGAGKDPEMRMMTYAGKLPFGVEIIYQVPADNHRAGEKSMHGRFAERRLRGEWFALTNEELDWIGRQAMFVEGEFIERKAVRSSGDADG